MKSTIYITPIHRKTPYRGYKYSHTDYSFYVNEKEIFKSGSHRLGNISKFKKYLDQKKGYDLSNVNIVRFKPKYYNKLNF